MNSFARIFRISIFSESHRECADHLIRYFFPALEVIKYNEKMNSIKSIFSHFRKNLFVLNLFILPIVGFLSFCMLFGIDENTIKDNVFNRALTLPFHILAYPAFIFVDENAILWGVLLVLQVVFYSLIIERVLYLFGRLDKKKSNEFIR